MRSLARAAAPLTGVALASLACASEGFPPGGPPDNQPPVVVETEPADRSVKATAEQAIRLRFDETLDPSQATRLPELILVNPDDPAWEYELDDEVVTLVPRDALIEGLTYSVTIRPGLRDREGNATTRARSILFSVGGETPITLSLVRARIVRDTVPAPDATLRLEHREEEFAYTMGADSQGMVTMEGIAYGPYVATAWIEQRRPEGWQITEEPGARDTFELTAENRSHEAEYRIAVVDTTPPLVTRVEGLDSRRLNVVFDEPLAGDAAPAPTQARLWKAPQAVSETELRLDSIPVAEIKAGDRIPIVEIARGGPDRLQLTTGAPLEDGRIYRVEFVDVVNRAELPSRPEGGWTFRIELEGPAVWDAEPIPLPEGPP